MLGVSLSIINPETGPLANFKVLLVTLSAGLVAYGVNRFAIDRGAPLAAIGFQWAMVASLIGMLSVGIGMFIGTYTGVVYNAVVARQLEDNGAALMRFVSTTHKASVDSTRAGPVLRLVSEDLAQLAYCEKNSSCLSGASRGGFGPVAAALKTQADRANAIATAFERGDAERRQWLKDLNRHSRRYQETLSNQTLSILERRVDLQAIHTEVQQVALVMSESLPIGMLNTFTDELQAGVTVSGQFDATRKLNDVLGQHGDMLADELEALNKSELAAPEFPRAAGMLDSLRYVGEFAAFAAVIFVAELILPITLWLLTYLRARWEIEKRSPPADPPKPDVFNGLINLDQLGGSNSAAPSSPKPESIDITGEEKPPAEAPRKRGRPRKVAS